MIDKTTYAPFILIDDKYRSLLMTDEDMVTKQSIFHERAEGWEGNGYDWTSIAHVLISETLPHIEEDIDFDPEAGMFSAQGSIESLKKLALEMKAVYDNDERIRDLLSRAELD